jgi:sarcosine oxidase subunit alpha
VRVEDHPILGKMEDRKEVTIFYNEKPIKAFEGEPIASDLWQQG